MGGGWVAERLGVASRSRRHECTVRRQLDAVLRLWIFQSDEYCAISSPFPTIFARF